MQNAPREHRIPPRICAAPNCKVRFTPPTKRRVYCSPRCKNRDHRIRQRTLKVVRICASPGCENTFEPLRMSNVYCSQACQERMAMGRRWARRQAVYDWKVPRICARPGCGVIFTPSRKRVICCSPKCRNWLYHGWKGPTNRTCARPGCGRTFISRIGNRRFCSESCERRVNQPKRFQRMIDRRVKARDPRPEDWYDKPILWRIIGTELLSSVEYLSNREIVARLDGSGILKCPYAATWKDSLNKRAFVASMQRVRKWVHRPGKEGGATRVNTQAAS
jgi:hypothetical protein